MNIENSFPVKPIRTDHDWSSLVIGSTIQRQVNVLKAWLQSHSQEQPTGFRALFAGSPGTGKATAALLAKESGREVFHISLAKVVSPYVGETEKNLDALFQKAQQKNWILFFDEADALFGKRTEIKDAHDKYANEEGAYLLQKIEAYNGLVILATSNEDRLNDVVITKLNSVVHFGNGEL